MEHPAYRPRLASGLTLPLRALARMLRDPHDRAPALLVLSLFIVGTVFYTLTEDWSIVDAFYFSTMTLATVGFGDLAPSTDGGKLFTVVYVLVGVGILVSFFSELTRSTLELRAELRKPGD